MEHKYLVLGDDGSVYWTTKLPKKSANEIVFDVESMRERSWDTGHEWIAIEQRGATRVVEQRDEAVGEGAGESPKTLRTED